jgi:hypothetical protein
MSPDLLLLLILAALIGLGAPWGERWRQRIFERARRDYGRNK